MRFGLPLTSTTHIRQAPLGNSSLMWHSVGIFSPAAWAASRIEVPGLAWIFLLLIVRLIMVLSSLAFDCTLTSTESKRHTSRQVPQRMHFSSTM